MKRILSLAPFVVLSVFTLVSVQACGPDFYPDIFVHHIHPDVPRAYASGMLGVILPTYPRADLAVAYRYLNGGRLTPKEQEAYHPTYSIAEGVRLDDREDQTGAALVPPGPADLWLTVRARYAPPLPGIHPIRQYGFEQSAGFILAGNYENCQADAFRTAASTLEIRVKTWGSPSPELADWIKGQDAVFSNCSATRTAAAIAAPPGLQVPRASLPASAPANAPLLLQEDRAYQIAAAQFYAAQFEPARASFQAIAQSAISPWRGIARYLEARCIVREAFLASTNGPDDGTATFNAGLMKQAQQQLESIRDEHLPGLSRHAVEALLNLVRLRTEPQARLRELSTALAGPGTDPDYAQNLEDLTWYLNGKLDSLAIREDISDYDFKVNQPTNDYRPLTAEQKQPGFEQAFRDIASLRSVSPLIDWLITFQSPSDGAKKHAFAEWKHTGSPAWLAVAITKASSADPESSALVQAAAQVSPGSSAWTTITYHRLRLLIDAGRVAEARSGLASAFMHLQAIGSLSAVNLFTGLRMRAAVSLSDALADAPRRILERTSEEQASLDECLGVMKNPKRKYDCKKDLSTVEFSSDATAVFNRDMPLATLALAAQSSELPPQLRQSVAIVTWVRAVLLKNQEVAARMLPLLPQKLRDSAGSGTGLRPLMAILRNPGLRPYLDGGVQRSYSYDFVESYGDNWWCADWPRGSDGSSQSIRAQSIAFLSAPTRMAGESETKDLLALGSAEEYLGAQVLAYQRTNPSDPAAPEALYLTLRMIRYGYYHGWSAYDSQKSRTDRIAAIAYEVGATMRKYYRFSPWTRKAAPYVWPVKKSG